MLRLLAIVAFAIMLTTNLIGYTDFSGWLIVSPIIAYMILYTIIFIIAVIVQS